MDKSTLRFKKPVLVGLTGGPEVGKSEVSKILAKKGAKIISADAIGHMLLRNNKSIKKILINLFGKGVLTNTGDFDRKKIGAVVFDDPEIMASYNEIIHPPLIKHLKRELTKLSQNRRYRIVVVDAALIFEWGIADWFDLILVVTAKRDLRLSRLCRKGLRRNQAEKRLASQLPQRLKVALADYVIENNSSRLHLAKKVDRFVEAIENLL